MALVPCDGIFDLIEMNAIFIKGFPCCQLTFLPLCHNDLVALPPPLPFLQVGSEV